MIESNGEVIPETCKKFVNCTYLSPEPLLTARITIHEEQFKALIDTGSSRNLIQKSIIDNLEIPVQESNLKIRGLGGSEYKTFGRVTVPLHIYGFEINATKFEVVEDHMIRNSIILGRNFCQKNKIIIDLTNRRISRTVNSIKIDIYLDASDNPEICIQEGVGVYAAEDVSLKKNYDEVAVKLDPISENMPALKFTKFYFEGNCRNKKIQGLEGVLESNEVNKKVLVRVKPDEQLEGYKIRKGECLGTVCTIVEMEEDEGIIEEEWTIEKLKQSVDIGPEVTEDQKSKIYKMLLKTKSALSNNDMDIGLANVTPHKILLTDKTPIWQKPRRFSEPVTAEIDRQCDQLEALDIIEDSKSLWSSPVVPVRKVDGSSRMCIDYRKLNKVTVQERFPMPNLMDSIYSAHDMNFFTKIDLTKGYYQVPIDIESRPLTSFSTPRGQFQFKRLSFGLRNSGIQFQRNIQKILSSCNSKRILIYIDDILILSKSFEEHLSLVGKVLSTLLLNGIKIKVEKCEFFKKKVAFLGHEIGKEGIQKSSSFIEKITNFPKPKTVTEMRRFLGLCNFQRKFVEQFSEISKPLTSCTTGPKKKLISWNVEMESAFLKLKEKLAEEVTLSFPNYGPEAKPLELYVDASGVGAGGCLLQQQEGSYKRIA